MSSHAASGQIDHHHDHTTSTGIPNKKLFMWAFLASDCMFFGTLISTHLIYRLHPPPGSPDPKSIFSIELTSFSTFILLMSSLLMALAVNACQKGRVASTRKNLLGTIFFGLIFLACQVYEFSHFVHEKDLTLSNSTFGSTFYTLTGTHGCHVAIGVLWLILMYIRTFKPADADAGRPWIAKSVVHLLVFLVTVVASIAAMMGYTHVAAEHGWGAFGTFASHHFVELGLTVAGLIALFFLGRDDGQHEFGEANAIDVESMGLYWHFVDIVWIVIFTAVYLLEYV
ncbi:heme-copper oxidase subunit III [Nibricoccus sp. IMCC34717]|uniref:cytochrome c oxidase subunit 3 n=1 Tax=Nibricoccus sp. IMCC34717 TaxID=3034021 RepID=UPI00384CCBF5